MKKDLVTASRVVTLISLLLPYRTHTLKTTNTSDNANKNDVQLFIQITTNYSRVIIQ